MWATEHEKSFSETRKHNFTLIYIHPDNHKPTHINYFTSEQTKKTLEEQGSFDNIWTLFTAPGRGFMEQEHIIYPFTYSVTPQIYLCRGL